MDTIGCDVSSSTTFFLPLICQCWWWLWYFLMLGFKISFDVSSCTRSTFHSMLYCNSVATLVNTFSIDHLYQVYVILYFAQQKNGAKILSDILIALTSTVEDFTCSFEASIKLHFVSLNTSGGSRKFWWGGILSTKPEKFGCLHRNRE